jgi:hypothetical protein
MRKRAVRLPQRLTLRQPHCLRDQSEQLAGALITAIQPEFPEAFQLQQNEHSGKDLRLRTEQATAQVQSRLGRNAIGNKPMPKLSAGAVCIDYEPRGEAAKPRETADALIRFFGQIA